MEAASPNHQSHNRQTPRGGQVGTHKNMHTYHGDGKWKRFSFVWDPLLNSGPAALENHLKQMREDTTRTRSTMYEICFCFCCCRRSVKVVVVGAGLWFIRGGKRDFDSFRAALKSVSRALLMARGKLRVSRRNDFTQLRATKE